MEQPQPQQQQQQQQRSHMLLSRQYELSTDHSDERTVDEQSSQYSHARTPVPIRKTTADKVLIH